VLSKAGSPDFRRALAQFATGVTVVTTTTPAGVPVGVTVNSFNSVSLQPPLVVWSLALAASTHTVFRDCPRYLVHVLSARQLEIARRFAQRGVDRFAGLAWYANASGLPQFDGCVARFECSHRSHHVEGDHLVLIGAVERHETLGGAPLIFHDSRYITDLREAPLPKVLRDVR
jgi:flavin reductase (DIM6/NTAB) family NADH-FMN oxidoreductase RutF